MGDRYEEIHQEAVQLARKTVGADVLLAGSIGSAVGSKGLAAGGLTEGDARELYSDEANLLAELGVDFLIVETFFHLNDMSAALDGAKEAGLPIVATVTFYDQEDSLEDGSSPAECAHLMAESGADALGINCMREPERLLPLVQEMGKAVDTPLALQPVAISCHPEYRHISEIPDWTERALDPAEMAVYAREANAGGIRYIGSCCGSGPAHVRAMAEALGKRTRD